MDIRSSIILLIIFSIVLSTNQTTFLNDEGIEAYKEKVSKFVVKITDFSNKIIEENKGKSEDVKTEAYQKYRAYLDIELKPYLKDAEEADSKILQANTIISKSKNMDEIAKAKEDLAFYTEKMTIMENIYETLRNIETNVILKLTFGEQDKFEFF